MVKNILLFSVLILAFSSQAGLINGIYDPGSTPINEREQFVANQVIVKFKSGYDPETLAIESDKSTYIITLNGKKSVEKAVEIYSKLSFVEYAEANYLVYPMNQSLP